MKKVSAESSFKGKVVRDVRDMTPEEMDREGWSQITKVIEFTDGTLVYASSDDEGNGPGVLFGVIGEESIYVD